YSYLELDQFTDLIEKTIKTLPTVSKVSRSGLLACSGVQAYDGLDGASWVRRHEAISSLFTIITSELSILDRRHDLFVILNGVLTLCPIEHVDAPFFGDNRSDPVEYFSIRIPSVAGLDIQPYQPHHSNSLAMEDKLWEERKPRRR